MIIYNFPAKPYILPLNLTSFSLTPTSFKIRTIKINTTGSKTE